MKRGFFEEGYDDLLEEAIKKYCPEELIGLVPRGVPHLDQPLPDYIEKQKVKLSFEEQQKL